MDMIQEQIQQAVPTIPVSVVELPDGDTINETWLKYGTEGVTELIKSRIPSQPSQEGLTIVNEYKIRFEGNAGTYLVIGKLSMEMQNMKVSLQIIDRTTQRKHRLKIDLFEFAHVQLQCKELSEKQNLDYNTLEADIIRLTDLLETYREELFEAEVNPIAEQYSAKELTPKAFENAVAFLSKPNLLKNIDALLEQSGIIGEEDNRMMLFVIASGYKMPYLLHALVQGTSGEGKSHLLNCIAGCMPQEDVMNTTRITKKSLYHYQDKELTNKLILIQDFDGLDEEAQFAFREMQSAKFLTSSTVSKDQFGNVRGKLKQVNAHFASLTATTKAEVYYDNMSRSVVIGVDESLEQTLRIVKQQNQKIAGLIDTDKEQQAKELLRNAIRVLKSYVVINPYADKIMLPLEAKMLRRLNSQFQNFVSQITILHQYQRKTDNKGRLIATKEDIKQAVDIFFSAIMIKVDELDGSTRQFFEKMKRYVKKQPKGTTYRFTAREIRQEINISKSTNFKYFNSLIELEYIQAVEGSPNRGFKYMIVYWDDIEKLRIKIRSDLTKQLEAL
jgi:energy-coupling factor transporter ATP-binding protein EcfA2